MNIIWTNSILESITFEGVFGFNNHKNTFEYKIKWYYKILIYDIKMLLKSTILETTAT